MIGRKLKLTDQTRRLWMTISHATSAWQCRYFSQQPPSSSSMPSCGVRSTSPSPPQHLLTLPSLAFCFQPYSSGLSPTFIQPHSHHFPLPPTLSTVECLLYIVIITTGMTVASPVCIRKRWIIALHIGTKHMSNVEVHIRPSNHM